MRSIQQKAPLEKQAVKSFLTMTELQSALVLPVFEYILRGPVAQKPGLDPLGGVIPRFQRAVVLTTPQAAQTMASEIARMHGNTVDAVADFGFRIRYVLRLQAFVDRLPVVAAIIGAEGAAETRGGRHGGKLTARFSA